MYSFPTPAATRRASRRSSRRSRRRAGRSGGTRRLTLAFDDQIDTELRAASAVLVVWTPTSVESRWVRGEARDAADRGVLVPVRFGAAELPIDVRAFNTIDLDGWQQERGSARLAELSRALGARISRPAAEPAAALTPPPTPTAAPRPTRLAICVLPFAN